MLDAYQTEIIAFYLPDVGEAIHRNHLPDDINEAAAEHVRETGSDWSYWEFLAEQGYQAVSRYEIGEWESQRAYDFETYEAHEMVGDIFESLDRDDIEIEWLDADRYRVSFEFDAGLHVGVVCDECYERIE